MINTVIIDKQIYDVYLLAQSYDYISYIFNNPDVREIGNDMKILVKYNKNKILSKYGNNDFINLIKNLLTTDDFTISIEQTIVKKENDNIKIRQVIFIESQNNDLFFTALMANFKLLIEIDVSVYQKNMTKLTLANVKIIENNEFPSEPSEPLEPSESYDYQNEIGKLKKIKINKYLEDYHKRKNNFFQSDVKYSDNIIINILNILVSNAIVSEYMRNICEYFSFKNIDIYYLT